MTRSITCSVAILIAGPTGCASALLNDEYWPKAGPLGNGVASIRAPLDPSSTDRPSEALVEPTGKLDLRQAMSLALLHNPELAVFAWDIRAEEAEMIQVSLLPNPEAEVEIENFGGSGELSGFGASETTIAIGQTILLGGKREKRIDVARLRRDLSGWDYEVARIEALTSVANDFVGTLAAQQKLELARETASLAERIFTIIGERVQAGKASPVERTKASVELAQARLGLQRAERELDAARHRLASNWGSVAPSFEQVAGALSKILTPPTREELTQRIALNPDLARWATEMALRRAAIALAKAEAIPNVTPFGGVRLLEGADDTAFVAGISMPIPLFDRNQGSILEARIRGAQAERLRQAAAVRIQTDLVTAYLALDAAYQESRTVRDEIEPSAQSALQAAEEAFRQGKIGALDLLDAQRTLFSVQQQYIDALALYHQAVIAVERQIGSPLHQPSEEHDTDGH